MPTAAEVDDVIQEILVRIHKGLDSLHDGERFGGCNVQCTYSPTGNACNG